MIKTIFDPFLREETISRAKKLEENLLPKWGTLNAFQMVKHCRLFEAWIQGVGDWDYSASRTTSAQASQALAQITADDTPLMHFAPSSEVLIVKEAEGDFELEKNLWLDLLKSYQNYNNPSFVHDFFGKMTPDQIGILAYKHTDHHLRQFGL